MSKPRVFVSSTYYDLKSSRADIDRFIKEYGFDPILHERGNIPYGKDKELEDYCYREISNCDIFVSIVGGKYGTPSRLDNYSISQMELKKAYELQKQVYIFIENSVLSEYRTYQKNKDKKDISWAAVDSVKIYSFIDEIYSLRNNNPITGFETSIDITNFLREQWSGLFQRLLHDSVQQEQLSLIREANENIQSLRQLVNDIISEKDHDSESIKELSLINHPIFSQLRRLLKVKYRVFFVNKNEMGNWLRARSYRPVDNDNWDSPDYEEWILDDQNDDNIYLLKIRECLFETDGQLKIISPTEFDEDMVKLEKRQRQNPNDDFDDSIPF